ncbi:Bro-N domain-containing protein [Streptococcus pyogenes]
MELQVFTNEQFGEVRTATINNQIYFNLNDCCQILELSNPRKTIERLNKDGVTTSDIIDSLGRTQQANFINESNFYKLVFQSRKPEAEKFADWVTSEVLPSIRKHGAYMTEQTLEQALTSPDFLIRLANELKRGKGAQSSVRG